MDKEKNAADTIPTEDEVEEVVFSGAFKEVKKEIDSKNEKSEKTEKDSEESVLTAPGTEENDDAEDLIVFAGSVNEDKPSSRRQPTGHKRTNSMGQSKRDAKKNKLKIAVIVSASVVTAAAAAGILFSVNYNRNSVPTVVETESEASQTSKQAAASEKDDSEASAVPVIRDESAQIKTINTATIVFGDNVTVSGVDLSGKTLSEAYDAMQDRLLELRDDVNITVSCDGKTVNLSSDDFEYDTDISDVLIQAYHYSRGELDEPTVGTVDNGGITDFVVTSVLNKDCIDKVVEKVAEKIEVQPVDAHVKTFEPTKTEKFTFEDGTDGFLVDHKELNSKITEIIQQPTKTGSITMTTYRAPFKVSIAQAKANTKLIASSETTVSTNWASAYNMELAIKTCNGYVVNPGETFSFNKMTGDTTTGELGYVPSNAIVQGRYEQQYGGGICQASTTIYICALRAGMEVVERHAHQFASAYADRGLDATVDYGNLDMKFKNTKDYPIYIATYVYDCNKDGINELCVEMYGPVSTEYDEIVAVGWVDYASGYSYSAKGAQVYFKDGKEVKRVLLPRGSYDYQYDSYSYVASLMPSDTENGPSNVKPTNTVPKVYSPNGCGSSSPIPYGSADKYLSSAAADTE